MELSNGSLTSWGYPISRTLIGVLLLVAGVSKLSGWQTMVIGTLVTLTAPFVFGWGIVELLFAIACLTHFPSKLLHRGSFLLFTIFLGVLIIQWIGGEATYQCLGGQSTPIVFMFLVDCLVLGSLFLYRSQWSKQQLNTPVAEHYQPVNRGVTTRMKVGVGVFLFVVTTGLAMAHRHFQSLGNAARWLQGSGVLIANPQVIEVGLVEPQTTQDHKIRLTNVGKESVTIHGGIPGCACTTLFSEFPIVVKPGQEVALPITIQFDPYTLRRDIRFEITYLTSHNTIRVRVTGTFQTSKTP